MKLRTFFAVAVIVVIQAGCSSMQLGSGSSPVTGSAGEVANADSTAPQLVRCQQPVGTVALVENQIAALAQAGLTSPIPLIRLIAAQSRCFNVVERGEAFNRMLQERQLAGMLQPGSNVGVGQIVVADYLITPNIVFSQDDAGGAAAMLRGLSGAAGLLGSVPHVGAVLSLAGSVAGSVAGSLRFAEAQAIMTVTDTRSGAQFAVAEGRARATDLGGGLGLGSIGGFGGLAGYGNTSQGKVVAGAFLDAFNKLVEQMRAQRPQ